MFTISEIKDLSREQKLRIMEVLWEDLSHDESLVESPGWHADRLRETEERFKSGRENAVDWTSAKNQIRSKFE
ncbi:MAG TPA: addiction module protein [Spirochaetota bacterium]|nr:addiction module protein [Spirochaetota bacterium]